MKKKKQKLIKMHDSVKLLTFDIETTDLNANRGHMLSAAARWYGEKTFHVFRIDDNPKYGTTPKSFFDDRCILKGLVPLLEEADAVVAFYGTGFDVPYVTTRCIIGGLPAPVPFTLIDPYYIAKSYLKLDRNGMGAIAGSLNLVEQKSHVPWSKWQLAKFGHKASLDEIVKYNKQDIAVLEEVYTELAPLFKRHPHLGPIVSGQAANLCPVCASTRTKSHDSRRTRTFEVFRRRCLECGHAFETNRKKIK
jgi:uncharacterized protein YprB with RNaseH-like and TPR domain